MATRKAHPAAGGPGLRTHWHRSVHGSSVSGARASTDRDGVATVASMTRRRRARARARRPMTRRRARRRAPAHRRRSARRAVRHREVVHRTRGRRSRALGHGGGEVERCLRGAWNDVGLVEAVERLGPRSADRDRGIVGVVAPVAATALEPEHRADVAAHQDTRTATHDKDRHATRRPSTTSSSCGRHRGWGRSGVR